MIECIFTIDYEIYGNGEGSLRDLVYEPAGRLMRIFRKWNARFVTFVEVAELEMIGAKGTDGAIDSVKQQIRELHGNGFELGLHLHPQWYNGRYENGRWFLDYSEYNLCTLPKERIVQIVDRSIAYFRDLLGVPDFTPLSFRAGNWLFQPTQTASDVLSERGIKIDSSVFKGGLQLHQGLDYRPALKNGYYWRIQGDANTPDPEGALVEMPIYSTMVPFWKMLTTKRIGLQRKGSSTAQNGKKRLDRLLDFLRFWYPLKFDFCRMTIDELTSIVERVIREDQKNQTSYKPLVAIGHTKDLVDFETIEKILVYLGRKNIPVSTLEDVYLKCKY
jgi:hypothetical protein